MTVQTTRMHGTAQGHRSQPGEQATSVAPTLLLVVEDDPVIIEYLRELFSLQKATFQAEFQDSLGAALRWLATNRADVILLDLRLPDSDGIETVLAIRAAAPEPAVVVMTASDSETLAMAAMEAGAQDYLVKGSIPHHAMTRILRYANARRQAQSRLQRTASFMEAVLERMPLALCMVDPDSRIRFTNRLWAELLETPPQREQGGEFPSALPAPLILPLSQAASTLHRTGGPVRLEALEYITPGAQHKYLDGWLSPLADTSETGYFIILLHDLTEMYRATAALHESEARFRIAAQASNDIIYERDLLTGVATFFGDIDASHGYEPGGYPRDVAGWYEILHPDDAVKVSEAIASAAPLGRLDISYRVRRKDGGYEWWHDKAALLHDDQGIPYRLIGAATNVTAQKRQQEEKALLDERLRQQQKLESIGTLAGGVAHEINNPLNVILNYGQIILDDPSSGPNTLEYATEIVREAERVASTVSNLMRFAREGKEAFKPISVQTLVERTLSLTRKLIEKDRISVELIIPGDLPQVLVRQEQIRQVLMNLVLNARDSLNERHPSSHPDKSIVISAALKPSPGGPLVCITVADQGTGIRPDHAPRIFDPFFTTKPRDKSMGLGLSVSFGIVKEHGGELAFETELGVGTRFSLDLRPESDRIPL